MARLTDAGGNGVAEATITMNLSGGGTLSGTTFATTNAAGSATFDDLHVNSAGNYQLVAVNGSVSAVSNSFQVSPATASVTISVYEGDGQSALAGSPYGGPLKALVLDLFGNPLSGIAVTFAAPATGPSVTFAGSPTVHTDANGIAISPAMTANTATGSFAVTATAPNAPTPATFPLTNLQPAANQLKFLQHPTDTPAGVIVTPPVTGPIAGQLRQPGSHGERAGYSSGELARPAGKYVLGPGHRSDGCEWLGNVCEPKRRASRNVPASGARE